jgi:hypothetical protein
MPLFFILSGYMMKYEKMSILKILFKDNKLISSYFVYSCIFIVFGLIKNPSLRTLIYNVGDTCTLYGIHALWFFSCLWIAKFIIRVLFRLKNSVIRCSLVILMYSIGYWISVLLRELSYNGVLENLAKSLSWSIVRACVILIFVYLGYVLKTYISSFLLYFKEHIKLNFVLIAITGALLIPFVQFEAVDYHLLKNGIFVLNLIYGIIGTLFILSISIVVARFFKRLKNIFINIGKNSVHYIASEYFGFSKYVSAILDKVIGTFPYYKYIEMGIYCIVLYFAVLLLSPYINKVINFLSEKLNSLENKLTVRFNDKMMCSEE